MATRVQAKTNTFSGATSVAATFDSALTPGSHIVVMLTMEDPAITLVSIADTVNTYTTDSNGSGGAGTFAGWGRSVVARAPNASTSALTVTGTVSASSYGTLVIEEWTGLGDLDVQSNSAGGGISSDDTLSATTTTANCVGFRCGTYNNSSGGTTDSGWTQSIAQFGGGLSYHQAEHNTDAGAAGSKTTTFTAVTSQAGWSGAMAFYKLAGGDPFFTALMSNSGRHLAANSGRVLLS